MADSSTHGPGNDLCFNVPITNDTAVEVQECFRISISLPSGLGNLMLSIDPNNQSALCCIEDDDSKQFIYIFTYHKQVSLLNESENVRFYCSIESNVQYIEDNHYPFVLFLCCYFLNLFVCKKFL